MYSISMDDIDYQSLIRILSLKPQYPLSMHLRNHLLAAYSAQHNQPDASKQDPWVTYKKYRKGVQLVCVGDVPASIHKQSRFSASDTGSGLWGIAILFPTETTLDEGEARDEEDHDKLHIWHDMRLLLWLSSETETKDKVSIDNVKVASTQEEALIEYLLKTYLPRSIQQLCHERNVEYAREKAYQVDLFAVNEAWVQVMRKWTQEDDARIQLTRANPCMTFLKSEKDSLSDVDIPSRWQVGEIRNEDEVKLVQSSNSLRFPLWYLEQRKHISTFIRDGKPSGDNAYPTCKSSGSPAAWAYAHDDLSLASLHVAEPYRRSGLGKICVNLMGKKLIQAQKRALSQAHCYLSSPSDDDIPTPYLLDTEMHKGSSRLFFEAQDFRGVVVATWGSFLVTSHDPLVS